MALFVSCPPICAIAKKLTTSKTVDDYGITLPYRIWPRFLLSLAILLFGYYMFTTGAFTTRAQAIVCLVMSLAMWLPNFHARGTMFES